MSTESTGAAEPGAAAAVPSEPPTATPSTPASADAPASVDAPDAPNAPASAEASDAPASAEASDAPDAPSGAPTTEGFEHVEVLAGGEEPARKKRKFGVGAMFLTAVVAGPVIGGVIGYGIQASRPATPLPELAAVKLSYPAERIDAKALAAAGPQPLNIDGDLRELLIKRPDGTEDDSMGSNGWMSAADVARTFGNSAEQFSTLLSGGFRRQANVSWISGDVKYRVSLRQYRPESVHEVMSGMSPRRSDLSLSKFAGNDESMVMVSTKPYKYARSSEEYYWGGAVARKGTVLMSIEVFAKNPVDRSQLEDIAKRQWERLA
ncbi:hypothetical protein ACFYST_05480 [Kitasatospora sp. NPDC004614]|uniref:hypothetical protein n=1 Tax=unclassified Kitasatospora TaxID=2633591 RepID=UPI0036C5DB7D